MCRRNLLALFRRVLMGGGLLAVSGTASANVVTFDPIAGGPWGGAFGQTPGDLIFTEDAIDVGVEEFHVSGFVFFNQANLAAALPDFGSGRIMAVNNINMTFRFLGVPDTPCAVQFDYLDQGGIENIRVNGAPLIEDDLDDLNGVVVAPGVTMYVSTTVGASGLIGKVLLDGPVSDLRVGGQEFFLDDVRTVCPSDKECDHVVDHETLAIGNCYGSCVGQMPGDQAFVEDGVPVFLAEFLSGGPVLFNFALVDPPFWFFGKSHIMQINNIDLVYDFAALPCEVASVSFDFADLGGTENFSVNGAPIFIGDLPAAPNAWPPNVTLTVTPTPIPGGIGIVGRAVLAGTIQRMRLGGQEFWVDNVCVECAPIAVPDEVVVAAGARLAPVANPYRAGDAIAFSIEAASEISLGVYDVRGGRVATLAEGPFGAGEHLVAWSGRRDDGGHAAPGVYFLRLATDGGLALRKLVTVP